MTEFETDYPAHHGIKGQKWGVRRTPEELGHRSKAPKAPKKSIFEKAGEKRQQRREKNSADEREALKDYLRKHPKKMPKYAKALTESEANDIISKIQFDRKLKNVREEEVQAGWDKIRNASIRVNTLYNLLNNSKNLYNTAAEINNALIDVGAVKGKKWVRVGGKDNNQNNQNNQNKSN